MDIHHIYTTLTPDQKAELRSILNAEWDNDLSAQFEQGTPTECPKCGHEHFKKNGKVRGAQRYKCVSCKATFGNTNNTLFYRTQKDLATWNQYIDLMFDGFLSVRKIAERVGVHYITAFNWRHKILHALRQVQPQTLGGVVEVDETFFTVSYKGKKRGLPRKAHKRGGMTRKRGISKDKACVLTAVDRAGGELYEAACLGRIATRHVVATLGPYIAHDAVLVTDKANAYYGFAASMKLGHHFVVEDKYSVEGLLHLQKTNATHSNIKRFMRPFNGVATKYLDHYMAFFQYTGTDTKPVLTGPVGTITCRELTAMPMRLE